jgi:hypothetical protein
MQHLLLLFPLQTAYIELIVSSGVSYSLEIICIYTYCSLLGPSSLFILKSQTEHYFLWEILAFPSRGKSYSSMVSVTSQGLFSHGIRLDFERPLPQLHAEFPKDRDNGCQFLFPST